MDLPLIVVGVDGSPASRTALRRALDEVRRSGAAVEAAMAWRHESEFVPAILLGGGAPDWPVVALFTVMIVVCTTILTCGSRRLGVPAAGWLRETLWR